jgi:outer membrane protein TolC
VQVEEAGARVAIFNFENAVLTALSDVESALIGTQINEDRLMLI